MDPQLLARIHEPFFTTKGAGGTGLGMCIVKSLVEGNGGALEVFSRPGHGTEVDMTFDLDAVDDPGPDVRERAA
jgi:signal transduction histidine kinase